MRDIEVSLTSADVIECYFRAIKRPETDSNGFDADIQRVTNYYREYNKFIVSTRLALILKTEPEKPVMDITTQVEFILRAADSDSPDVPTDEEINRNFIVMLAGLAYSTSRGLVSQFMRHTPWSPILLPIVDPESLLPADSDMGALLQGPSEG